jgi:hypothetical protein
MNQSLYYDDFHIGQKFFTIATTYELNPPSRLGHALSLRIHFVLPSSEGPK